MKRKRNQKPMKVNADYAELFKEDINIVFGNGYCLLRNCKIISKSAKTYLVINKHNSMIRRLRIFKNNIIPKLSSALFLKWGGVAIYDRYYIRLREDPYFNDWETSYEHIGKEEW